MRVIDCSTMVSGPLATQILAEQGADVVKVEAPPPGDVLRVYGTRKNGMSGWFANTNKGKRAIVVDLDQPDGGPSCGA
jgi:crotonobetainyl-CoA:carnitine CoA-transferase CaiB-like acyl-CoA transferase